MMQCCWKNKQTTKKTSTNCPNVLLFATKLNNFKLQILANFRNECKWNMLFQCSVGICDDVLWNFSTTNRLTLWLHWSIGYNLNYVSCFLKCCFKSTRCETFNVFFMRFCVFLSILLLPHTIVISVVVLLFLWDSNIESHGKVNPGQVRVRRFFNIPWALFETRSLIP